MPIDCYAEKAGFKSWGENKGIHHNCSVELNGLGVTDSWDILLSNIFEGRWIFDKNCNFHKNNMHFISNPCISYENFQDNQHEKYHLSIIT